MISWNNDISVYFLLCNSHFSVPVCKSKHNLPTLYYTAYVPRNEKLGGHCNEIRTGHRKQSSAQFTCAIFGFDTNYNNNLLNMSWFLKSNITGDTSWPCHNDLNRWGSRWVFHPVTVWWSHRGVLAGPPSTLLILGPVVCQIVLLWSFPITLVASDTCCD